ncbi:MAG: alpha/beta hydrolase-fold protein [Proteobacteria bacterium]|jgi:enterochelin esterase-like enzyme|nr:alpha/beta hydrolase-fold protein [Pseudomonadota bacterium]
MPRILRRLSRSFAPFRRGERLLAEGAVESRILGRRVAFATLAPPAPHAGRRDLPVVLVLHGLGDDHLALDDFGIARRLARAMAEGRLPPFCAIAPDGERGFWINWHDGSRRYEDCLIREILPAAERALGVDADRGRRHVVGVSMGGIGALHVGLRHPELFASAASLSGAILDEEQAKLFARDPYAKWFVPLDRIFGDGTDREFLEAHNPFAVVRGRGAPLGQGLFIAAGEREKPFFAETTRAFHRFLERASVPHAFEMYPGGHGWRSWAPVLERAIGYALASPSPSVPLPVRNDETYPLGPPSDAEGGGILI